MFFSLELNENSQIPVKKGLEQPLGKLLYILEGQKEEIAWSGVALGFDYFHVCGYTPINALNVLVNIMKSDVNSKTFSTVFTPLKNLHIHSA